MNKGFLKLLNAPKSNLDKLNLKGAFTNEKGSFHKTTEYKNGMETKFTVLPYLKYPLFFFDNGVALTIQYDYFLIDSTVNISTKMNLYNKFSNGSWGSFKVINETVEAIIYIAFYGKLFKRHQLRPTFFKGIIKNKDTILNWHMIPPYPAIDARISINQETLDYLKLPKNLFFTTLPEREFIDPSMSWINKYRHNQ